MRDSDSITTLFDVSTACEVLCLWHSWHVMSVGLLSRTAWQSPIFPWLFPWKQRAQRNKIFEIASKFRNSSIFPWILMYLQKLPKFMSNPRRFSFVNPQNSYFKILPQSCRHFFVSKLACRSLLGGLRSGSVISVNTAQLSSAAAARVSWCWRVSTSQQHETLFRLRSSKFRIFISFGAESFRIL